MDSTKVQFDEVREEIVKYLQGNSILKDYNFNAPVVSVLIDALAYQNTMLLKYTNFALNECFLESAKLRGNVVSQAKTIGYIPHQYTAAKANLKILIRKGVLSKEEVIGDLQGGEYQLPRNLMFQGNNGDRRYTFRTLTPTTLLWDEYYEVPYADIEVVEGTFVTERYQITSYNQTKEILNPTVDTDYITVVVYENNKNSSVGETYRRAEVISDFKPESKLYYLSENYDGNVEISFGDGVLSYKPEIGSMVEITYLVTNGPDANGITEFSFSSSVENEHNSSKPFNSSSVVVELSYPDARYVDDEEYIEGSFGGGTREDIDRIRFNAPKFLQSQNRAVTTNDYNALILNKFGGNVSSITTWGGEENFDDPAYSYVFTCIRPRYTDFLSSLQKKEIKDYIENKAIPCIDLEIVDPTYINVTMNMKALWNSYMDEKTIDTVESVLRNATLEFFDKTVYNFEDTFKYSNLLVKINELLPTVDSILTDFTLYQFIYPEEQVIRNIDGAYVGHYPTDYHIHFLNRLRENSIQIGPFGKDKDYFADDGKGNLNHYRLDNSLVTTVGSVDYKNGDITISKYDFGYGIDYVKVSAVPYEFNIYTKNTYLLKLLSKNLKITINTRK